MEKRCPNDIQLEKYVYGDISFPKRLLLKRHLGKCPSCRERLDRIERFNRVLSSSPFQVEFEPPSELLKNILDSSETWAQDNLSEEGSVDSDMLPSPPFRLQLALSGVLMVLAWAFQWRLKDYFPGMALDSFFVSWRELVKLFELFKTGLIWESLRSFFLALRTDGISAIGILGSSIPILFLSVIVCGTIVTVFFVRGIRSSRSGGDRV